MAANAEYTRQRRLRWFDAGADAIHRILQFEAPPCHRRFYMCPLCGSLHDEHSIDTNDLTDEHVPPKGIGGRPLVLTCSNCNNAAGTQLDWHAAEQLKKVEILRFQRGQTLIRFAPGVNGLLRIPNNRTLLLSTDRRRSDPRKLDQFHADLDQRVAEEAGGACGGRGPIFTFWVPRTHDDRRANLSYVRAAYLVGFALFGYRLILSPSYQPIRRQLREMDEAVITQLPVGTAGPNQPDIFIGHIADVGDMLVVRFGERWVGLPPSWADLGWWERLAEARQGSVLLHVRHELAAPRWPLHLADRQALPPAGPMWQMLDFFGDSRLAA